MSMTPSGAYEVYPVAYSRKLKNMGRNDMRMAFLHYWDDYMDSDIKSNAYYANIWTSNDPRSSARKRTGAGMSRDTVKNWVTLFQEVIEQFEAARELFERMAVSAADSSAKKQVGEVVTHKSAGKEVEQSQENRAVKDIDNNEVGEVDSVESSQVLSYNTNTTPREKMLMDTEFHYLYVTCRFSNKNLGSKEKAYEAYIAMKSRSDIDLKNLATSYAIYMNDFKTHSGNPYGLANYLNNDIYMSYVHPFVRLVDRNNQVHEGWYSKDDGILTYENGQQNSISSEAFMKMMQKGNVEILRDKMKAKVE